MAEDGTDSLMTTGEVAAVLRVREQTLRAWRASGRGPPYVKIAGMVRYVRTGLERWIEEREVAGS